MGDSSGRRSSSRMGGRQRRDDDDDHRELQESIVRRTNDLFVKLNITTRPIQAFEELQKSATSMFVAIFETLFNVRLNDVIRKPRVVTDYIRNAQLVMTALSESLSLDLSFLSGEAIYNGDPHQIHDMLSIFESLWNQLSQQRGGELLESGDAGSVPSDQELLQGGGVSSSSSPMKGVKSPYQSPTKHRNRSKTPFPDQAPTSPFASIEASAAAISPKLHKHSPVVRRLVPADDEEDLLQQSSGTGGIASSGDSQGSKKKRVYKKKVKTKKKRVVETKPQQQQQQTRQFPKRTALRKHVLDENTQELRNRIQERKKKERDLPSTKGSQALGEGIETAKKLLSEATDPEKENIEKARSHLEMNALEVLAEQYPTIYKTVWNKKKMISKQQQRKAKRGNALAVQMEQDLERYRKAYNLLVKTLEGDQRKKSVELRKRADMARKSDNLESKIETARNRRMKQDLQNKEKSSVLRQKTKEEVLVQGMFTNALKLERDYFLSQRRQREEERNQIDTERMNRYESIKRYYEDRESMLKEKIEQQERDQQISLKARQIALKQLESELRKQYDNKLAQIHDEWDQQEQQQSLYSQEHVENAFQSFITKLKASAN